MARFHLDATIFDSNITILVEYEYRPGADPIVSGSPDNWVPGYPAEVQIKSAWLVNPTFGHAEEALSPLPDFFLTMLNDDAEVYDILCSQHEVTAMLRGNESELCSCSFT